MSDPTHTSSTPTEPSDDQQLGGKDTVEANDELDGEVER